VRGSAALPPTGARLRLGSDYIEGRGFILHAVAGCDIFDKVKLLSTIHRALAVLAIAGLILAPLARPSAETQGAMSAPSATDTLTVMAMPADMPCCPDKTPASDCGKDCPLMALCITSLLQCKSVGAPLIVPLLADILVPADDANLGGLTQAPHPRPPKA